MSEMDMRAWSAKKRTFHAERATSMRAWLIGLPMSRGVGHGELRRMLLHQCGEPVEHRLALLVAHARPRPVVERPPCRGDGPVGVGQPAAGDRGPRLARVRIDVVHRGAVEGRHLDAVDDVSVEVHARSLLPAGGFR
jgi:hypothetical protein